MRLFGVLGAVCLSACGPVDRNSRFAPDLPEWAKQPSAAEKADTPPDVRAILRENSSSAFLGTITKMQVGVPLKSGNGWVACVKIDELSGTGAKLSGAMYLIEFVGGKIGDRLTVGSNHYCAIEKYNAL